MEARKKLNFEIIAKKPKEEEDEDTKSESKSSDVDLDASSDHELKTKLMKYYLKVEKRLGEQALWTEYANNIIGISAQQLYNLLNQETSQNYPKISDPNYLLILDVRSAEEYSSGHILTSRRISRANGQFKALFGWEIEYKQNIVIYDTFSLAANQISKAFQCAVFVYKSGSRYPVKILNGGYAEFCKNFPDYYTSTIFFTQRELDEIPTYPNEILPHRLYLGRSCHSQAEFVVEHLKIKAFVKCDTEHGESLGDKQLFLVPVPEYGAAEIKIYFESASQFIHDKILRNQAVLVFSTTGNSISAVIVMAYLMLKMKFTYQQAYAKVKECRSSVTPNLQYMKQLEEYTEIIFPNLKFLDIEELLHQ